VAKIDRARLQISITSAAYAAIINLDKSFIGTCNYMGIAPFWHHDYQHYLRCATATQRAKIHRRLLAAGLDPGGFSPAHDRIIAEPIDLRCQAAERKTINRKP